MMQLNYDSLIGESQVEKLRCSLAEFKKNGGFVAVDDFLEADVAETLRSELTALKSAGVMESNKVQFNFEGKTVVVKKPSIYEADLFNEAYRNHEALKLFRKLYSSSGQILAKCLRNLGYANNLITDTSGLVVKLQCNIGRKGCFPLHYDNPGIPNKRKLTCLIYLNPSWEQGDGGELEIQPFLAEGVKIEPKMNRLVIFESDKILHRVLPNMRERYCFTIWIDGSDTNTKEDTTLRLRSNDLTDTDKLAAKLRSSAVQRLLARATYAEQFERSMVECMGDSEELQILLAQHYTHLDKVKANEGLSQLIHALKQIKL